MSKDDDLRDASDHVLRDASDHVIRRIDPPRPLDGWEARAIERIAGWHETVPALRQATEGLAVRAECDLCASVVLTGTHAPLLDSDGQPGFGVFPGELRVGTGGSEIRALLHIVDGRIDELQVYRADGEPATDRPDVEGMGIAAAWDVPPGRPE